MCDYDGMMSRTETFEAYRTHPCIDRDAGSDCSFGSGFRQPVKVVIETVDKCHNGGDAMSTTVDGTSSNSRSTSVEEQAATMNNQERKIWAEWDKRESNLAVETNGEANTKAMKSNKSMHVYRQASAHKKLLDYSQRARRELSSPSKGSAEISEADPGVQHSGVSRSVSESSDSNLMREQSTSTSSSSASNSGPESSQDEELDRYASRRSRHASASGHSGGSGGTAEVAKKNSLEQVSIDSETKSILNVYETDLDRPLMSPGTAAVSNNQRKILEKVISSLCQEGLEVLKLSRDNKWQLRHITVSKEVFVLHAPAFQSERTICPEALLWLKRFNPRNQNYSAQSIDNQGHGGILLKDLRKVQASSRSETSVQLPKKYQSKFKDSVVVRLECSSETTGQSRSIHFCCRQTNEAHFLCTGLRVMVDVIERESKVQLKDRLSMA